MQSEARRLGKLAIQANGKETQWRQLQEECGELTVTINHYHRGRATLNDIAEEVADVEICCEQAREMVGDERVEAWKKVKLERLAKELLGEN